MDTDDRRPLVGLIRVSTGKQAESGLGLEGQLAALEAYRAGVGGSFTEIYREIESGKHNDIRRRPKLREAAGHAIEIGGTLVIAKLDRLVRSVSILVYLRDSGVKFVACDYPHVSDMVVGIMVVVAEDEAERISTRTREALRAYREGKHVSKRTRLLYPDGVPADVVAATAGKLGSHLPGHSLTTEAQQAGRARSAEVRRDRAIARAEPIGRILREMLAAEPDLSLRQLAERLNARKRQTPRGKAWGRGQVKRVLDRLGK